MITHEYVKAHQDCTTPWHKLLVLAKLNCTANKLATKTLQTAPHIPILLLLPASNVQFILQGKAMNTDLTHSICLAYSIPRVKAYWGTNYLHHPTISIAIYSCFFPRIFQSLLDFWCTPAAISYPQIFDSTLTMPTTTPLAPTVEP